MPSAQEHRGVGPVSEPSVCTGWSAKNSPNVPELGETIYCIVGGPVHILGREKTLHKLSVVYNHTSNMTKAISKDVTTISSCKSPKYLGIPMWKSIWLGRYFLKATHSIQNAKSINTMQGSF